jgi:hypothetical protein
MTTALGRNVKLEIAATFGAAKNVTAVTLASPGVATSTSHGMSNGTVGYWTVSAGMVQLDGQATRVYNQSTNAFDLQGLNTTGYSTFSGTQTFTPVSTWNTLGEAIGYSLGGGSQDRLDDSKLTDVVKQDIFGLLPPDTVQIDLLSQTFNGTAMQTIEDASIAGSYQVYRITLNDGSVRVFRGIPSRPGESLQRAQLATGSFQVAVKGFVLRGAA